MKMNPIKTIFAAICTLFVSALSFAQPPQDGKGNQEPPSVEEIFKQIDKDEDGKLSKKELKGPLKNSFVKIDSNEDGFLSKEEVSKAPKPKGPKSSPRGK
ncbi:EF-hand domain-containing protein [Kriegella aquimaris]|uniref:EF hand n=1 Tax=Kriegella aquimaris TaxID=192904 RepID=A0A1G9NG59_9FLAO|nr:EF-hand domain-containing protein [Kriegella aquimaris]SDL85037.1 EF hand [Kriegella aquimaris]